MKTFKLIIVLLAFNMTFFVSKAENPPSGENSSYYTTMMLNEIRALVDYPDFAREFNIEGFVLVSFTYNSNGTLNVLETNTNSEALKKHVITRLGQLEMCTYAKNPKKTYNMRFDFKLL